MLTSLRARLLVLLILSTGAIWLSAVGWIYLSTQAEIQQVLDRRLSEAARMVSSLVESREIAIDSGASGNAPNIAGILHKNYDRQLSCQIWSLKGQLIGQSGGAPTTVLTDHEDGFAESVVDGENWRVFAVTNQELGIRVLVGDNLATRDRLVDGVVRGLLTPMALMLPFLIAIIWLSVGRGLAPLNHVAATLRARDADDMRPIEAARSLSETRPLIAALNGLFHRVDAARARERDFTAFAAHELRTPLAGLKTQAQVALAAGDDQAREGALRHIVTAVDRLSRLVAQLLASASIEANPEPALVPLDLRDAAGRAVAELSSLAIRRDVRCHLDATLDHVRIATDRDLFHLALRNLLENAIQHSPAGSTVTLLFANGEVIVRDHGPAMDGEDLSRATERFYRGRSSLPGGSGLGLSIARMAAEKAGLRLHLRVHPEGGLEAGLAERAAGGGQVL